MKDSHPSDQPAPQWLSLSAYFFRLGLGLFLILSLLLSSCVARAENAFWQPATSLLTPDQIKVIIEEHSSLHLNQVTPAWVEQTRVHGMGNLILVDFNTSALCGSGGCLYVGYRLDEATASLQQVLYLRLRTQLPPGFPLFQPMEESLNGLPCFTVHQMRQDQVEAIALCFDGTQYVKQSTVVVTPHSHNQPKKSLNDRENKLPHKD
jgi:hypothetical protein